MQARMSTPAMIVPDAMQALHALGKSAEQGGMPSRTLGLAQLRASQIHGCSVCVDMLPRFLKQAGETDERLFAVVAWREVLLHQCRTRHADAYRGRHSAQRPI